MAKKQWEVDAKDRFVAFLQQTRGGTWRADAEDVVVDAAGHNYDFRLVADNQNVTPVALEIYRLVDDEEELARQTLWNKVIKGLRAELDSRAVTGYLIEVPHFTLRKSDLNKFVTSSSGFVNREWPTLII